MKSPDSSGNSVDPGKPDWTKQFGVTTDRVDSLGPQSPSDFKVGESVPPEVPVEDRGTRSESDGWDTIWDAYREGY